MDDDQQFCLRWNNHQTTLVSVFDTLLENDTLTDCTLAAEGKFLKAHKVVISACSPYFAAVLKEQHDKHPIFILKDIKFQELKSMMEYMYRGEVNICQDQLAALLKAAESLQIKGLSDNRSSSVATAPKPEHHRVTLPTGKLSSCYTLEQTKRARVAGAAEAELGSREGSCSPSRRRRKVRRRSIENTMSDVHDNSNSSQHIQQTQSNASGLGAITAAASALAAVAAATPSTQSLVSNIPLSASASSTAAVTAPGTTLSSSKKTDIVKGTTQHPTQHDAINTENAQGPASAILASGSLGSETTDASASTAIEKSNHKQMHQHKQAKDSLNASGAASSSELVIEPKAEYDDEANDEPVEDLTLDEDDVGMDDLDQNAGTSQAGEGSSQSYAPWQHDRSPDELLLATQEAQQRDPQVKYLKREDEQSVNNEKSGMDSKVVAEAHHAVLNETISHGSAESTGERFTCLKCSRSYLRRRHLMRHSRDECIDVTPRFGCHICTTRFRRKYHLVRHLMSKHKVSNDVAQQCTGNAQNSRSKDSKKSAPTKSKPKRNAKKEEKLNQICDNGLPQNLSMQKERDNKNESGELTHSPYIYQQHRQFNNVTGSPSVDSYTESNSSLSPTQLLPIANYRLPPISPAATHVEERDAQMILEAAHAAVIRNYPLPAIQASTSNIIRQLLPPVNDNAENVAQNFIINGSLAGSVTPDTSSASVPLFDNAMKMKLSFHLLTDSMRNISTYKN